VPLKQIYWGVIPFWMGDFLRLGLILAFPAIALAIPNYFLR
jgi:TRAP-type mannitol/chloroaromatic compound transport system permease large subunit